MNIKIWTSVCVLTLTLSLGCGAAEEPAGNSGNVDNAAAETDNTDLSPALAASDEAAGTNDRCADGRFEATETFSVHNLFPFDFEHPVGWRIVDTSKDDGISGNIDRARPTGASGYVSVQYVVVRTPMDKGVMEKGWSMNHEVLRTVDYGGETLDIWSMEEAAGGIRSVNARFMVPHEGKYYQANFIFQGPEGECIEERERLRTVFLDTVAPNPDTTF